MQLLLMAQETTGAGPAGNGDWIWTNERPSPRQGLQMLIVPALRKNTTLKLAMNRLGKHSYFRQAVQSGESRYVGATQASPYRQGHQLPSQENRSLRRRDMDANLL